jgi:hypothetical protein
MKNIQLIIPGWNEGGNLVIPSKRLYKLGIKFGKFDCRHSSSNILLVRNDIIVRTTTPADWIYINHLAKDNSSSIGFLQKRTWHDYVWGGQRNFLCFIIEVSQIPVGYILLTPGFTNKPVRVQQIVIQEDVRRWEYGTALIDTVELFRKEYKRSGIILRCRTDLEANLFWQILGFTLVHIQKQGTLNHMRFSASKDINIYSRLDKSPQLELL